MESQAKGTHYNICACARERNNGRLKENTGEYGRALHDTRVLTCLTSRVSARLTPGLGMHDTRVSDTGEKANRTELKSRN